MRILVSNNRLEKVGGTENYLYTLAEELVRKGHKVEYFTRHKGEISRKLEDDLGVKFMSHKKYDLVLANHRTTVKRLFSKAYTIQTCHGVLPHLEQPSITADAWVGISQRIQQHLAHKGFPSTVIWNGINCRRFCPKKPLSPKLTKVLSLCHSDAANEFIESCCRKAGVQFSKLNKYTDNVWNVEDTINEADLVVGIGRSLYDAMACGRCVISYDFRKYMKTGGGVGYLNASNIEKNMYHNCIGDVNTRIEFTEDSFLEELKKYNPADGEWARKFALEHLNIEKAAEAYLALAAQGNQKKSFKQKLKTACVKSYCAVRYALYP